MMKILSNLTKWLRSNPADAPVNDSTSLEIAAAPADFPPGDLTADEESAIACAGRPEGEKIAFMVELAAAGRVGALKMLADLQVDISQALTPLAEADNAAGIKAIFAVEEQVRRGAPGAGIAYIAAAAKNCFNAMAAFPRHWIGLSVYGFQSAAEKAGENGATEAMALIAEELVKRWKENARRDSETGYYYALRQGFQAAAAKGHSEAAAVALRTLNSFPFAKEAPSRSYSSRASLMDA